MRIPKRYGSYRVDKCPFCGKQATTSNKQGVPTCIKHKDNELLDLKCACGDWLDLMDGKYGPYFKCMKCGNVSFSRALEINADLIAKLVSDKDETKNKTNNKLGDKGNKKHSPMKHRENKKETVITSDMVDVYFS